MIRIRAAAKTATSAEVHPEKLPSKKDNLGPGNGREGRVARARQPYSELSLGFWNQRAWARFDA